MDTIIYIIIGALACLSAIFLINKNKANKINLRGWIFSISALLLIFFGAAWAQISVHENELQAAIVGLLLFGGIGVVFGILSFKHIGVEWPSKLNESKTEFSIKSLSVGVLIVLSTVLLIFTLLFNKVGLVLSNPEEMSDLIIEQVISDDALPKTIKKAVVYQILYDSDDFELEQRIIIGILGSIDEQEWVELFDMIVSEKARIELVKNATASFNDWVKSDIAYPAIEIKPSVYTEEIKKNAEKIILWIYQATLFPPCDSTVLQKYDEGVYSDNIQDLIGCKPPLEYREQLAKHAAILLTAQIDSANVPSLIRLEDKIAETMTKEQMIAQKKEVKKMRSILHYIFILPLLLIGIGISMLVFTKTSLMKALAWPAIISGTIGLILGNYLSDSQNVFDGFAPKLAETVPAPALSVIQNLMAGIIDKALPLINVISIVSLLTGIVLLALLYFNKFKGLYSK